MPGDQHATMVDLHQPGVAGDLDGLAGQPGAGLVGTVANPIVPLGLPRLVVTGPDAEVVSVNGLAGFSRGSAGLNRSMGATPPND